MGRRFLFGPVTSAFAEQNLDKQRQEGRCLVFGHDEKCDFSLNEIDNWAKLSMCFPSGWKPDFLVLNLPYTFIPEWLWSAPIPIVGLASDWPLLWHYYRRRARSCDLLLTDQAGVETFEREGVHQARAVDLHGCESGFFAGSNSTSDRRDIDILFVGNANAAVQPERLPWLMRVARMAKRWRVSIRAGLFGDSYRRLLRRAKIVFSYVEYPRASRRHSEALAAGALLFEHVQRKNELPFLEDRKNCIFYDVENLEALLDYYLEKESARQRIVASAQSTASERTFEKLWDSAAEVIERQWSALVNRSANRSTPRASDHQTIRLWQASHTAPRVDVTLIRDLDAALSAEPSSAQLHNSLGLALAMGYRHPRYEKAVAAVAAEHFERAVAQSPAHLAARLNLAEALHALGNRDAAIARCQEGLVQIERPGDLDPVALDCGQFHGHFDDFRVAWERAAWSNAGNPRAEAAVKKNLLKWRFHLLLCKLTGELVYQYEAQRCRPTLPFSAGSLGVALAGHKHHALALAPLRQALAGNPFDRDSARALGHMLTLVGDRESLDQLIADRKLLSQAAPQLAPAEPWFSDRKPTGQELVSIIVLCCNELDYTRQCLESVLKHTRAPFELILVDNGSNDGTPAYLEQLRFRPEVARVDIVRNETNLGFPKGCNQGLARARGRYIVFLNNDTIVTPGWLDTLIGVSLHDWPNVGLVGPVSNYAPDAQGVRAGYEKLDGLDAFAARRRREFAGRTMLVSRLTGFCLLARREALDRIGGFDERYGLGFFDDDDLCFRALEAGFKLVVAPEVYIHHFGSRTFAGLKLDTREELQKNFSVFRDKWGVERTAGYQLPKPPPAKSSDDEKPVSAAIEQTTAPLPAATNVATVPIETPAPSELAAGTATGSFEPIAVADAALAPIVLDIQGERPDVSLCMIVKNEEARLGACLESAADLFGNVVITDTGSTDKTREIAKRFGAHLVEFPWVDSFAAARNESIRHATGRWIMWLDADDRIDKENHAKLAQLFKTLGDDMAAYAMRVRSVMDANRTAFRLLDQVRLFPNHPKVRWEYRVHEQTLPAVNRLGGQVRWTDIVVDHVGYQDVSVRRGKLERNLRLLEIDAQEKPADAFVLFNLGWTLLDLGRTQEALSNLESALENAAPDSSIVRKLYHLVTVARRQTGQKEAARDICRTGLTRFPDDTELLLEEGLMHLESRDLAKAEMNFRQLVETTPGPYFGSFDDGVRGFRTRHLLAGLHQEQHQPSEAELQLRTALMEKPSFLPAWMMLGELYLNQGRFDVLGPLSANLERETGATLEAAILRARMHLARHEFQAARNQLEHLLARYPDAVGLRVLLSHILLQEGRYPDNAERILNEILRLDPGHTEAKHNLAILHRQRQPTTA